MSPKSDKSSEFSLNDKLEKIDKAIEFNAYELELLADFYLMHGHDEEAETLLKTIDEMKRSRRGKADKKSVA